MSPVTLEWTDALSLKQPLIDETHHQMVDLINELAAVLSTDANPLPSFQRLLEHTIEHFGMEERWMAATGFEPDNCHSSQHKMVLNVMHEVVRHATELKDLEPMRIVVGELAQWLPAHAEMMDAALVFHMSQVGYDPASGSLAQPLARETAAISGCGSQGCSD
ncbi:hemerythrin domain-containing protein [Kinneretia asaccharophila]|uniref:Hemerythrin-like metal-binding protein n=1 Tax=Roseateles asaccharophilus TaxID=582607 RepID=A0A4R6MZM5_9BURK|nr:hemerythrin domain-containing protein [Roseateles asaccharophilus]MDN3545482.1 hemerythrin domain-containing protein [Roseateles asaccharophilus]TDP07862.1 hemerythrin-like metal-binding protein [Roseateles asaccharophilus]